MKVSEINTIYVFLFCLFLRPNCFQIVVQHFSEEHYIFYFAGETPEQAQVRAFIDKHNFVSHILSCSVAFLKEEARVLQVVATSILAVVTME